MKEFLEFDVRGAIAKRCCSLRSGSVSEAGRSPRASADRLRLILDTQITALVNRVGASPRSVQVRELGYR
jgi:hypothetical protein